MKKLMLTTIALGLLLAMVMPSLANNSTVDVLSTRKVSVDSEITFTNVKSVTAPRAADGIVNKYAVIVGISDYSAISDLSFCDEDATDWYYQLSAMGYEIILLGDHTNAYPQFDGLATEYNVKTAIGNYLAIADEDDIVVYASSGHGSTIRGKVWNALLCMWDCNAGQDGEDGRIYNEELGALYAGAVCQWFIFLDHCFAGGMTAVMNNANAANGYLTTTCTDRGYGYDMPDYNNGAWTYIFLEYSWQGYFGGSADVAMEDIFTYAAANYPFDRKDMCQEFDGATTLFYL